MKLIGYQHSTDDQGTLGLSEANLGLLKGMDDAHTPNTRTRSHNPTLL